MTSVIDQLLDLARWAPSGDNTQPWRFEVIDESHLVIHGADTRDHCVYDLDGRPSQMSLGALIETLAIAASGFGLRADIARRDGLADTRPTFDVYLTADAAVVPSALRVAIPVRSVQRRPFRTRQLSGDEKTQLETALAPGYRLRWIEGWVPKWQAALLMFNNAELRLTMPEAYRVHRDIIHWNRRFSADRVPDQALGADALTLRLTRWVMHDWERVRFFNRWLAGTWLPRLQMDLLPGLACGAHFVLLRDRAPNTIDDYVEAGRMVQRLWLSATLLGLQHQPELTPLIFSRYVRDGLVFSQSATAMALATRLARQTLAVVGPDLSHAVWIGRVGEARFAASRSLRRARDELTLPTQPVD